MSANPIAVSEVVSGDDQRMAAGLSIYMGEILSQTEVTLQDEIEDIRAHLARQDEVVQKGHLSHENTTNRNAFVLDENGVQREDIKVHLSWRGVESIWVGGIAIRGKYIIPGHAGFGRVDLMRGVTLSNNRLLATKDRFPHRVSLPGYNGDEDAFNVWEEFVAAEGRTSDLFAHNTSPTYFFNDDGLCRKEQSRLNRIGRAIAYPLLSRRGIFLGHESVTVQMPIEGAEFELVQFALNDMETRMVSAGLLTDDGVPSARVVMDEPFLPLN